MRNEKYIITLQIKAGDNSLIAHPPGFAQFSHSYASLSLLSLKLYGTFVYVWEEVMSDAHTGLCIVSSSEFNLGSSRTVTMSAKN